LLLREDEQLDDWFQMDEMSIIRTRTERMRAAYIQLRAQDKRVAVRLRMGVVALLGGYFAVFVAFGLYIWSITK